MVKVEVELCGVPTPRMGPWKSGDVSEGRRPRYAVADGLSVTDKELTNLHVVQRLSAEEIARRIKERPTFVRKRLRNLNIYDKTRRPLKRKLDDKQVVLLYRQGYSPTEIGKFFGGVSHKAILLHLRKAGVVLLPSRTPVGYAHAKIKYAEKHGKDLHFMMKKFSAWRKDE